MMLVVRLPVTSCEAVLLFLRNFWLSPCNGLWFPGMMPGLRRPLAFPSWRSLWVLRGLVLLLLGQLWLLQRLLPSWKIAILLRIEISHCPLFFGRWFLACSFPPQMCPPLIPHHPRIVPSSRLSASRAGGWPSYLRMSTALPLSRMAFSYTRNNLFLLHRMLCTVWIPLRPSRHRTPRRSRILRRIYVRSIAVVSSWCRPVASVLSPWLCSPLRNFGRFSISVPWFPPP